MQTLNEEIIDIVGLCPLCDADPNLSYKEAEKQDMVNRQRRFESGDNEDKKLGKWAKRLLVACPECMRATAFKSNSEIFAQRIEKLRRDTYGRSLLPEKAKRETFHESKPSYEEQNIEIWNQFRNMKDLKLNLWFFGGTGTGKTHLAHSILNLQIESNRSVAEVGPMKLNEIGRGWEQTKPLEKYRRVNVLLIDDIDKVEWSKEGVIALWNLIDSRATDETRLIITSNIHPSKVKAQIRMASTGNASIADSMFDRFMPMEKYEMIGESLRSLIAIKEAGSEKPNPTEGE